MIADIGERVRSLWQRIRDSLWVIPAAMTVALGTLALFTVWLDKRFAEAELIVGVAAGADGARGVLMTIAGSLITVTGVVFSITIVALQLASSQYTPRVLRSFRADRSNQIVLGIFIGTFTYALIVLGTVRSELEESGRFVPVISVALAVLLCLVSIGFLIFFINHIAHSIQAEVIINRVTKEGLEVVDQLFPEDVGLPAGGAPPPDLRNSPNAVLLRASKAGYLQEIREKSILAAASEGDLTVRMERQIGEFILEGDVLATIEGTNAETAEVDGIAESFVVGVERTNVQDVERGLIELTDIAVRALSPGINDPTTAIVCIDRITQILAALGSRRFPDSVRVGPDGQGHLITRPVSYDHAVRLAFSQLRHHGAANPAVALRIVRALVRLAERLPPDRLEGVLGEIKELRDAAKRSIESGGDLERVLAATVQATDPGSS